MGKDASLPSLPLPFAHFPRAKAASQYAPHPRENARLSLANFAFTHPKGALCESRDILVRKWRARAREYLPFSAGCASSPISKNPAEPFCRNADPAAGARPVWSSHSRDRGPFCLAVRFRGSCSKRYHLLSLALGRSN